MSSARSAFPWSVRTERSTREVRIIGRLGRFLLVGVQPRRDADLEIAQRQIRRERAADIALDFVADAFFERQHLARPEVAAVRAGGQQLAIDIEHGDLIDRHAGQRGGDEMAHGLRDRGRRRRLPCAAPPRRRAAVLARRNEPSSGITR